jgi:hypothetical protein
MVGGLQTRSGTSNAAEWLLSRSETEQLQWQDLPNEQDPLQKGRSTVTEQLDRTLVWNQRHLMIVLREYEDLYNRHRPHRTLNQAAPLRPLPDGVIDLDQFRVRRRDRSGGVIHEYRLVA